MEPVAITHRVLWAKADTESTGFHRLLYHLIDVGCAACVLWEVLNPSVRHDLSTWLQRDEKFAGQLIAFWAALHDLGKASPAFQYHHSLPIERRQFILSMLEEHGLLVPSGADLSPPRHEVITTWALRYEVHFHALPGLSPFVAQLVGQALGGHHGHWPDAGRLDAVLHQHYGNSAWKQARLALALDLVRLFLPPDAPPLQRRKREDNIAMTLFSGFVTVADWVASNSRYFPYEDDPTIDLAEYQQRSLGLARDAFQQIGWYTQPAQESFQFEDVFGFGRNLFQSAVHQHLLPCTTPTMAIIEAPMGGGKTEAALDTFVTWAQGHQVSGLYVAMPTMATSNQMYYRVSAFLRTLFGSTVTALLAHSAAFLQREDIQRHTRGQPIEEQPGEYITNLTWFLPGKKNLLTPFGVGTVDQALLGILQTKHSFLRLFGLSHKVIIFDEVHAYDHYMSALFERLLVWLRNLNCSVIILSATLPQMTRERLVKAYGGQLPTLSSIAYPRVTWVNRDGTTGEQTLPAPEPQILNYAWIANTPEAIAERLRIELEHGGCAAVICNTVAHAQDVFRYLRDTDLGVDDDDLWLFHARTPFYWRQRIEQRVLERFGPGDDKQRVNPLRPTPGKRVVLVATQVIEQSLDLDFDVMLSELAPIDLLLQRAGRLHRHPINNLQRQVTQRCLWIAIDQTQGLPVLDGRIRRVYNAHMLYRTWLTLAYRHNAMVTIPDDIQNLIDLVYGDQDLPNLTEYQCDKLAQTRKQMLREEGDERRNAQQFLLEPPESPHYLYRQVFSLVEDDPTLHRSLRALTRSGAPGIKAVCLHRRNGQLWLDADDENEEDRCGYSCHPQAAPDPEIIRELTRRTVSIDREDVQTAILALESAEVNELLKQWRQIPALRYSRALVFESGVCRLDTFILRLDRALGLQIERTRQ